MALLTWSHACSIGVKAMDDQHAILMDTLNDIRLALMHGYGRDQVNEALKRLIELTRMHFINEEKLLEQHEFPGLTAHREAHQHLLGEIEAAALHAQQNDDVHMHSLLVFLRNWYFSHIEEMDHEYGLWLNKLGIA